jgi:DNA-binding NarL/FixJ family response regulator
MELYCGARTNVKPTTVANNNAARPRKNQRNGEHSYRLPKDSLSPRETEVGKLLADGLNLREAALQLKISVRTAASHLQSIYVKLGLHERCGLVIHFAKPNVTAVRDTLTNSMSPKVRS